MPGHRDREPLANRFLKKVYKTENCWFWLGSRFNNGHGKMTVAEVQQVATHVSWFLAHGEWPPADKLVLHTCDIRQCVRPDHLFLGTQGENTRDAVSKGCHGRIPGETCKWGHRYDRFVPHTNPSGRVIRRGICLACKRASWRRTRT